MRRENRFSSSRGYTIIELVVTMGIAGVLMGMVWVNLQEMMNPARSGAATVSSFFKEARARAISTTSAYTIQPITPTRIQAFYSTRCGETLTQDTKLILDLPDQVSLTDITWSICFNSRGFPLAAQTVTLQDAYDGETTVELFYGGAVRFQEG